MGGAFLAPTCTPRAKRDSGHRLAALKLARARVGGERQGASCVALANIGTGMPFSIVGYGVFPGGGDSVRAAAPRADGAAKGGGLARYSAGRAGGAEAVLAPCASVASCQSTVPRLRTRVAIDRVGRARRDDSGTPGASPFV